MPKKNVNIMVMVLSDVAINTNTDAPRESVYKGLTQKVKTTNESAIRYLQQELTKKGEQLDAIYAFASQTVQGNIKYNGKEYPSNENPITHLAFIQQQLSDIIAKDKWHVIRERPNLEGNNNSLEMDKTLYYTLRMADAIQSDVRRWRDEHPHEEIKITLHADCTGGPRHAVMMLIDIIRLLQYAHLTIGEIVYSNWNRDTNTGIIERANDVYDFYNLIAGAEEFVNFGSVKDIQAYFQGKQTSKKLKSLLMAMADFADNIGLCRSWSFVDAIDNLKEAIKEFEKYDESQVKNLKEKVLLNGDEQLNDELMMQLLPQLRSSYHDLLNLPEKNRNLELIRWCLKHDLLQQALTLYTETVPDYLFDSDMLTVSPKYERKLDKEGGYYILNHYGSKNNGQEDASNKKQEETNDKADGKIIKALQKELRESFQDALRKEESFEDAKKRFQELDRKDAYEKRHIRNIDQLAAVFGLLEAAKKTPSLLDEDTFGKYQWLLKWYHKKNKEYNPSAKAKRLTPKKARNFFLNLREEDIVELAGGIGKSASYDVKKRLLKEKEEVVIIHADAPKLFQAIEDYDVIKQERNHANHAKAQANVFATSESLKNFMENSIDTLEKLADSVKG